MQVALTNSFLLYLEIRITTRGKSLFTRGGEDRRATKPLILTVLPHLSCDCPTINTAIFLLPIYRVFLSQKLIILTDMNLSVPSFNSLSSAVADIHVHLPSTDCPNVGRPTVSYHTSGHQILGCPALGCPPSASPSMATPSLAVQLWLMQPQLPPSMLAPPYDSWPP